MNWLLKQPGWLLGRQTDAHGNSTPADPLARYYGLGLGQIPIDLRLDDVTPDAEGRVAAVRNDGGAGAYFAASAEGDLRPHIDARGVHFNGVAQRLTLANAADLQGVHLLTPLLVRDGAGTSLTIAGPMSGLAPYFMCAPSTAGANTRMQVYLNGGGSAMTSYFTRAPGVWMLAETRTVAGRTQTWVNGSLLADVTHNNTTPQGIAFIGGHSARTSFDGWIGRAVSVVVDDPAADPPAVTAARQALAAQYGVAL